MQTARSIDTIRISIKSSSFFNFLIIMSSRLTLIMYLLSQIYGERFIKILLKL
jgi:hypothetical protein